MARMGELESTRKEQEKLNGTIPQSIIRVV